MSEEETKEVAITTDLDRADEIVGKQKTENDRREEILKREEAIIAKKMVGGNSDAGEVKEEAKEETPAEYAQKVIEGKL